MKICLALLCLSSLFIGSLAKSLQLPASELHLRQITVRDGLPSAYINKILQRHDGFIWIASKGGLSRFDGKNFNNYQMSADGGVISNDVLSLLEDKQQQLWVGTARGLFLFDDGTQQFQYVALSDKAPTVLSLFQDPAQRIWVGTDQGLFQLAPDGSEVAQYSAELEVKVILNYGGKLWLGSKQGLFSLDVQTGEVNAIPLTGAAGVDVRQQRIFDAIVIDECFLGDTEVLTNKGFKRFKYLDKNF